MKNKEKKLLIVMIMIGLIVIGAVGYLIYDVLSSKENNTTNEQNNAGENVTIRDKSEYVSEEDITINDITTKKVILNYLPEEATKDFYDQQEKILNDIQSRDAEYDNLEANVETYLSDKVLSIVYWVNENTAIGSCTSVRAVTNIDLVTNTVLTEENLLDKVGYSYTKIVEERYNKSLELWEQNPDMKQYELTLSEFKEQKDTFINKGLEKVPGTIYTYVKDGKVVYDYYQISLDTLFYPVGKGGCFNWITEELGNY